jgi:hypothetical protein
VFVQKPRQKERCRKSSWKKSEFHCLLCWRLEGAYAIPLLHIGIRQDGALCTGITGYKAWAGNNELKREVSVTFYLIRVISAYSPWRKTATLINSIPAVRGELGCVTTYLGTQVPTDRCLERCRCLPTTTSLVAPGMTRFMSPPINYTNTLAVTQHVGRDMANNTITA